MQMTLRWFGDKFDSVKLEHIRQIPGVEGVICTLYDKAAGEMWAEDEIIGLKQSVEQRGLKILGIESVNIHDSIKVGSPEREQYIDNYIKTLENLGKQGINLVCYNFMPVFDWTRSDLSRMRSDGSTVLAYSQKEIEKVNPEKMFEHMDKKANGFVLPGWEPERMQRIKELFAMYKGIDDEQLFQNLKYFLERIMPTCEHYNIKMAIHPDDPAWPVFGLPRIMLNKDNLLRLVNMVDSPCNGVTLCTGSLGSNPKNNLPDIIRALKGKIHFAHVRNLKYNSYEDFEEAAHLSRDGSLDMFAIMFALHEIGFEGPVRPDHGRAIWGEVSLPGYGLYDRALGASYLNGLLEAIEKSNTTK